VKTNTNMLALQLTGPMALQIADIPTPNNLLPGEVLIKMHYSPVNPSDLAFLTGAYGIQKAYPTVPGFEGSGQVVASGGGMYAGYLKNKYVACVASNKYDGTWAQFMKTEASNCIVLSKKADMQQVAMSFVNPLTALDFIEIAKNEGFKAIVLTAAGSALAQMVRHLAQQQNIAVAALVRSQNTLTTIKDSGFDLSLSTEEASWPGSLKTWAKPMGKVLLADCIGGGNLPSKALACLPAQSKLLIYGSLDFSQAQTIVPRDFIFNEYKVQGYWLSKEAGRKSFLKKLFQTRKVQAMYKAGFTNKIQCTSPLTNFEKTLQLAHTNASMGKCLFEL
jgi:NADPH:quinone reductase